MRDSFRHGRNLRVEGESRLSKGRQALIDALGRGMHVGLRLSHVHAGFHSGDYAEVVVTDERLLSRRDAQWHPHVMAAAERQAGKRELDVLREYANDCRRLAVEIDNPAGDARIASESSLPQPVTDHCNAAIRMVFSLGESPTDYRRDTQNGKDLGRDSQAL